MSKAILYMTSELIGVSLAIYKKVQVEAKKRNQPLICYCGNSFHTENGDITPDSVIYDYINKNLVDGVILNTGALGKFSGKNYIDKFVERFKPLPVASLSYPVNDVSNILVDNYQGIYNCIDHLIKTHNYKNIAFVKGPEGHPEAEERLKAYLDVLRDNNLEIDDSIIAPGDFTEDAGIKAVNSFLKGAKKVEAIACVDDDSALGVYRELKNRGIKIPTEIAVTGFDDIDAAENLLPSLTTVKQPYEEMIRNAFDIVASGQSRDITVPTEGVFRESCGCRDINILDVEQNDNIIDSIDTTREIILNADLPISQVWNKELISALENDLKGDTSYSFIDKLETLMEETDDFNTFHKVLSLYSSAAPLNTKSRSIFQQARILINNISNRYYASKSLQIEELNSSVNDLITKISQVENVDSLRSLLAERLPEFNINTAYIALYNESGDMANINFCLKNGRNYAPDKNDFDPAELLPEHHISIDDNMNYLVAPLLTNEKCIGYGVFSINPSISGLIGTLISQIGTELNLLKLQKQQSEDKLNLEEKNVSIQELISPMLDTIKNVSNESRIEIERMIEIKKVIDINSTNLTKTIDMLENISGKITNVMDSISVINDISENVNVLAINTSIQAAHAGDYGKGFTVIAKEIRKLSDSSAVNAKSITTSLNETIKEFKEFTTINNNNVDTFKDFEEKINHFMEIFKTIASKMETLSSNSMNIIDIMER